jgi:ADP-heptose:LPS heptosyltransferase
VLPAHALLLDPSVSSLLLVRLRVGLGDLLCTVPAVRALRAARPDLHVAVATWPEMQGVVDRMAAWVDELVPFPGVAGIPERPPVGSFRAWSARVRARAFDIALQAYGDNPVANDVTESVGARITGGFAATRGPRRDPTLHLPYPHDVHEVDRHLRMLERLGLPAGAGRSLAWPISATDEADAAAVGLAPGRYAVVHPGATSASRRWPPQRFAAVAAGLAAEGLAVVVGGVADEAATVAAVQAAAAVPLVDIAGRTTLGAYAVLLRDAAVVVTNDTGTAHLTAAVGGHAVTVFLSGDPVRWRHGPELQSVVRADVGRSPCRHLTCPIDFRCAVRVSPDSVLAAALRHVRTSPTCGPPSARR